jgi:hypothetical protein
MQARNNNDGRVGSSWKIPISFTGRKIFALNLEGVGKPEECPKFGSANGKASCCPVSISPGLFIPLSSV